MTPQLVRTLLFLAPIVATGSLWLSRRPSRLCAAGALLATGWNLPAVFFFNVLGTRLGWWTFHARDGMAVGVPVDFWLSEVIAFGALPFLLCSSRRLGSAIACGLALDAALIVLAHPIVALDPRWLLGKVLLGSLICLLPAQLLARWTNEWRNVERRAALQVIAVSGIVLLLVTVVLDRTGTSWAVLARPGVGFHLLVMPMLGATVALGFAGVQEFVLRGRGGTPIPWDPPRQLVRSGPYAYVANPMHVSLVLLFVLLSVWLWNPAISLLAVGGVLQGAAFLAWDKAAELGQRHGVDAVRAYRKNVPAWLPLWRAAAIEPAHLHIPANPNSSLVRLAMRLTQTGTVGLQRSDYDGTELVYRLDDGTWRISGVAALCRALNHRHLLWAWAGWTINLPLIRQCFERLLWAIDAVAQNGVRWRSTPVAPGR